MNTKQLKISIIVLFSITLALLVLGLIFIGVGHASYEIGPISFDENGFDLIKNSSVGEVLTSENLKNAAEFFDWSGQLSLIRCGIVFAIILAPILFGFGLIATGFYFYKKN